MSEHKTLCKWGRKRIGDELDAVSAIVCHPIVVCRNCGRAVCDERFVCQPVALAAHAAAQPDDLERGRRESTKAEKRLARAEQRVAKATRRLEKRVAKAQRSLEKVGRGARR